MIPQIQRGGLGAGGTLTLSSTLPAPIGTAAIGIGTTAARDDHVHAAGAALTISGTGGAGYLEIPNQSAAPSTPTTAGRIYFDASNRLSWKGTNGFVRTFDGSANTADRIYTLPDAAGTVVIATATQTLTNKTLTTPVIGDFTSATHTHQNSSGGGTLDASAIASGTLPVSHGGTGVSDLSTFTPVFAAVGLGRSPGTFSLMATNTASTLARFISTLASGSSSGASVDVVSDDGAARISGDRLGVFAFSGANDAAHTIASGASTRGYATETWDSTHRGSKVEIWTTPNASITTAVALRVDQDKSVTLFGNLNISALNIVTDTSTGMQIATGSTQKLGFFGATPIVQVGATIDLGVVLSNLGLRAAGTAYPITTSGAVQFTGGVTITTTNLTLTDKDIALGTTTGTKIGTATNQKLSVFNSTPVVQQSAYTQTYATATKTHSNLTSTTLSVSVGTPSTTIPDVGSAFSQSTLNNIVRSLADQINDLRVDLVNAKGVLNSVIDDQQAYGWFG